MKTIRLGTFETNSSSCHSMSFSCEIFKIKEFEEGKRFYMSLYPEEGNLYTIEEIYEILKKTFDDSSFDNMSDGSFYCDFVSQGETFIDDTDFERMKSYIKKNFSVKLLEFALTDIENDEFPCKSIYSKFIRLWAESVYSTPIVSIQDMKDGTIGHASIHPQSFKVSDEGISIFSEDNNITEKPNELYHMEADFYN